jgi:hypothetical protein
MTMGGREKHWSGNMVTLEELAQIEMNAERSKTPEAKIILRLAAALREAMQISEGAVACMIAMRIEGSLEQPLSRSNKPGLTE